MTITVKFDGRDPKSGKTQIFLKGIRERTKGAIAPKTFESARLLRDNIGKEIRRFARNPTGKLERSFTIRIKQLSGGSVKASVESDLPYAAIHETGGRIRPTKGSALTIPMTATARGRTARSWGPKLFRPKGRSFLATRGGRGGGLTVQYLLRKSVMIRKKRYLTKAIRRTRKPMERIFDKLVRTVAAQAARRTR